jgi:hypothetical protein
MDIPREAVDAVARVLNDWYEVPKSGARVAEEALAAAFPHLRPLFQHATEVGRREALMEAHNAVQAKLGITSRALPIIRSIASPASDASSEPLTGSGVGTGDTEGGESS